jgi:hypothetical protein
LDEVMDDPDSAMNEDAVIKQVLDEIGVSLTQSLGEAPMTAPVTKKAAEPVALDADVNDLEARLENLRRDG